MKNKFSLIFCLLLFFSLDIYCQQINSAMGQEPSLFLKLQNIKLGTLSKREEKRQYLHTIFSKKKMIENYTLQIMLDNAYDLYKRGDFQRAKELSATILSIDPDLKDARMLFESASRMRGGRVMTERELLQEKFDEGMYLYKEDKHEKALEKWQEVLSMNPNHYQARKWYKKVRVELSERYLTDGDNAYDAGNIEIALDNWYKALSFNEKNPDLIAKIAIAESDLRNEQTDSILRRALRYYENGSRNSLLKAFVSLERALEVTPGHPTATDLMEKVKKRISNSYINTGKMFYSKRQYDNAIGQWSQARLWGYYGTYITKLINTAKQQMSREENLKMERIEQARIEAEQAAALEARREQERIRAELQEELQASEEIKKKTLPSGEVSSQNKRAAEEYYIRGLVHFQNGDYDEAVKAWTAGKELDPNHPEINAGLKRLGQN